MRVIVLVIILIGVMSAAGSAQVLEDVPPWHWAHDAVDKLVAAGIIVGFPPNDRDLTINAVTQVYDAFVHASHPDAQAWAERFLTNLPAAWPQPLRRSALLRYRLEQFSTRLAQGKGTVSLVAVTVTRAGATSATTRTRVQAGVEQDPDGRWRVNYTSLVAAQPEIFR